MGYFVINTGTNALPVPNDTELHLMFRLGVNLVGQRVEIIGLMRKNKRVRGWITAVETSPGWLPSGIESLHQVLQTGHGQRKHQRYYDPKDLRVVKAYK